MYYGNQVNVPGAAGNFGGIAGAPPPIIPSTDPRYWPVAPGGRPFGGGSTPPPRRGNYRMANMDANQLNAGMYFGPQMGQPIIQNAPVGFHNKYVS